MEQPLQLSDLLSLDGWQPIETAPKDGTPILLCEGPLVCLAAYYHDPEVKSFSGKPMRATWHCFFIMSEYTPAYNPDGSIFNDRPKALRVMGSDAKHWMPLPTPPDA